MLNRQIEQIKQENKGTNLKKILFPVKKLLFPVTHRIQVCRSEQPTPTELTQGMEDTIPKTYSTAQLNENRGVTTKVIQ